MIGPLITSGGSMKCIIAGSRTINHYHMLEAAIEESGWADKIIQVVSGGAKGVDALGEEWAYRNHRQLIIFPADWDTYGRSAGIRRNKQMALWASHAIVLWDGASRGSKNIIDQATRSGLEVFVYEV